MGKIAFLVSGEKMFKKIKKYIVALLFFYIMYLETFATESESTSRVFNIPQEELKRKNLNVLFKNQGVYNGLLGAALLYGAFIASNQKEIIGMLLVYIILVAIYGGLTSDKKIILKQGGLPILALISLFF